MTRPLPHETDRKFAVYAGIETDLIFNHGIDLPEFASFPLVDDPQVVPIMRQQMTGLIDVARSAKMGCILDTPTWMASTARAAPLGYDAASLHRINRKAVEATATVRDTAGGQDVLLALCLGPARDAYATDDPLSVEAARDYHRVQMGSIRDLGVDLVNAYTFNQVAEAAGAILAAGDCGLPIALSLVVEIDGRLAGGQTLGDAIAAVDDLTDQSAAYFMVNCAHPDHFRAELDANPRLKGVVVNASRCSHAELDEATELDAGDPDQLGRQVAQLVRENPAISVIGGCCGTDMRHLKAMTNGVMQ